MAMNVILLDRIGNLGDLGEEVSVRAGFARNFLIPQGKAVRATAENRAIFEERRAELEREANSKLKIVLLEPFILPGLARRHGRYHRRQSR